MAEITSLPSATGKSLPIDSMVFTYTQRIRMVAYEIHHESVVLLSRPEKKHVITETLNPSHIYSSYPTTPA